MSFGRACFGDNQFLGIHHGDPDKAARLERRFAQTDAILALLDCAHQAGVRDFIFTTHDRYDPVFAEILRSNLFAGMRYSPCLPYAHKYANAMAERGMVRVVAQALAKVNPARLPGALIGAAMGRYRGVMQLLVGLEIHACKGLPLNGVFLQNVLFDLMLAMDLPGLIGDFDRFVTRRLGAVPGYITMNHALAVQFLCDGAGLQRPWIAANLNLAGFRTHPSRDAVAASFASGRSRNLAMSAFAGEAPAGALDFVLACKGVDGVLFGSSKPENIRVNTARILAATAGETATFETAACETSAWEA